MPKPFRRPYLHVLYVVFAVWVIVTPGALAWTWVSGFFFDSPTTNPLSLADALVIAVGSLGIALAAILPGWPIILPRSCTSSATAKTKTAIEPETGFANTSRSPSLEVGNYQESEETSPLTLAIEQLGLVFLLGTIIRIGGTVALFLASSYYMQVSATEIGLWVLAWHLIFLLSEVIALSREI